MTDLRYLIDNNALAAIGLARRQTPFFRSHCRVTEDVLYEARFRSDRAELEHLRHDTTARALEHLRRIMANVEVGDTSLVDLYHNKGAADPALVAAALATNDEEAETLFPMEWIVVTRDDAILTTAAQVGVRTLAPEVLAKIIDGSD